MKRKLMAGIIAFCSIFCMTGCKEVVDKESITVEAIVVDKYHRGYWVQPIMVGKVITVITHPAVWKTIFHYQGYEAEVSGSEVYGQYEVGDTAECDLVTYYYDDSSIEIKLEYNK